MKVGRDTLNEKYFLNLQIVFIHFGNGWKNNAYIAMK